MITQDFQEVIHYYLNVFHRGERFFDADQKRLVYFKNNPLNEDASEIVMKISAIAHDQMDERVYSRQVLADHIAALHIDEALRQGAPEVVDAIAHLDVGGRDCFQYGFATRYCNWHNPGDYPIYDLSIRRLLTFYWQEVEQKNLLDDDFNPYYRFREQVLDFRDQIGMEEYNFKELDTFTWIYGDRILRDVSSKKQLIYH